jgi:hypothetical protein
LEHPPPEALVPKLPYLAVTPMVLLSAALLTLAGAKPCADRSQISADSLLARGNVAMGIPGTQRVALDASGGCLQIDVRTTGTARLVGLLLRTLEVPGDAVRFKVVS